MIQQFGSLSNNPGSTGMYYYSKFFTEYKITAEYKSYAALNLKLGIDMLISNNYHGFSLSMPFKYEVMQYLFESDEACQKYKSCNTVLVRNSALIGFNTDIYGVERVIGEMSTADKITILGNGCIGKMFAVCLEQKGFDFQVFSPSLLNWNDRHTDSNVVINCTPFGTQSTKSPLESLGDTTVVFDLTFEGKELEKQSAKIKYYSGIFFYKDVFLKQFQLYTGISAEPELFDYFNANRIK